MYLEEFFFGTMYYQSHSILRLETLLKITKTNSKEVVPGNQSRNLFLDKYLQKIYLILHTHRNTVKQLIKKSKNVWVNCIDQQHSVFYS